jgi:hypothetical protein
MKFSLISLIALALTSTSVMAQPVATINDATSAVEKRAALDIVRGSILQNVQGRKSPQINAAPGADFYYKGYFVAITCYTDKGSSVEGNP